ncbi:MAG: response regulator [Verrucomicrobium sp.]|nr:response regulator [Verrucomicrobium sp.]
MREIRTILLAEDNPKDVELTLEALSDYNLANEVVVVKDGEAALDYLHRRGAYANRPPENPALILLDIKMPKVDGLEVLKEIKSHDSLRVIPVVILSSSREERDLLASYGMGVNAYVVKPVKFHDFIEAVKALGLFWAFFNEPPRPAA